MNSVTRLQLAKSALAWRTVNTLKEPVEGVGKLLSRLAIPRAAAKSVSLTPSLEAFSRIEPLGYATSRPVNDLTLSIQQSRLNQNYQGLGYGRKLYGGVIRKAYENYRDGMPYRFIGSDSRGATSPDAAQVWESLSRRGYPVHKNFASSLSSFGPAPQSHYLIDLENMRNFYKDSPKMAASGFPRRPTKAMGIPDRRDYGDPGSLEPGSVLDYFIQRHDAERAGRHYDLRAGTPETGLYSWATKKELPEPGGRIALYQQPVHAHAYGSFSGEIGRGYGKGQVELQRQGKILITRSTPTAIHFSTAGPGPVVKRYALVKPRSPNDKSWLLVRAGMPGKPISEKETYKNLDPDQAESVLKSLQENATVQPKIDGALAFIRIAKNRAEIMSHRLSKRTGQPIVHTERVFGQIPEVKYPKELENSLLTGELYGERGGKAIPAQELGGILNAGVARSLQKQQDQDVALKTMLFGVKELKGRPAELPYSKQREMLQQILPLLPKDKFLLPEEANNPEDALAMFHQIHKGKHPLTQEGIVIHPEEGTPMKTKFRPEHDVTIREVFPGLGKYKGVGAGGFRYSHEPEGPIVGNVGTGLSDELRRELWEHPELYLGRTARVAAHDKFPSGALRVPSLIALHEG